MMDHMRQILRFDANQPVTVALEFPEGVNVQGQFGPQVKFSLTDNRLMYVDPDVAQAIKTLGVQPGELFTITKRWEKGRRVWWDLERVKSPARSQSIPEPSDTPQIAPQGDNPPIPETVPPRIGPKPAAEMPPRGGMRLTSTPPLKPSYEEAFRECLRIVTAGLAQTGEQWSDGAKQAMVSTIMIQLGRENRLGEFRPQRTEKVA